jgi:prepilin-type N-terminal cleavage/methylation domain-containing protein
MKKINNSKGFSLIEILISIAVAAVILPGIIALQSLSSFTSGQGETYTKAYTLAQQEMETIYKLKRDWDWDTSLSYTPPTSTGYTKNVVIDEVQRCGNQVCNLGFFDPHTRKVTVTVSWNERGTDQKIELISYVTKI